MENSLDAGASAIDIEIEGGGATLVRVRDDGSGIDLDKVKAKAQEGEEYLGQDDEGHVDDNTRPGAAGRNAPVSEEPCLYHIPSHLENRKEIIDRLADPAGPEHRAAWRPQVLRDEAPPARGVGPHRREMEKSDGHYSPSRPAERLRYISDPLPGDDCGKKRKPGGKSGLGGAGAEKPPECTHRRSAP